MLLLQYSQTTNLFCIRSYLIYFESQSLCVRYNKTITKRLLGILLLLLEAEMAAYVQLLCFNREYAYKAYSSVVLVKYCYVPKNRNRMYYEFIVVANKKSR